jgi:hypothetical protein
MCHLVIMASLVHLLLAMDTSIQYISSVILFLLVKPKVLAAIRQNIIDLSS